jgi:hypothetical protein
MCRGRSRSRLLFFHDAEVMLGMLVAVLGLDLITTSRRVLCHVGVLLIILTCISTRTPRITGRPDARRPLLMRARAALRLRAAMAAMWAVAWSARTLVQGVLRCWGSGHLSTNVSRWQQVRRLIFEPTAPHHQCGRGAPGARQRECLMSEHGGDAPRLVRLSLCLSLLCA